jgi:Rab3 GTPase-activating protein non-catalytic subunit
VNYIDLLVFRTWFSSNQPPAADPAQQQVTSEPMICRFGLCDMPRNALSIVLAPRERDNGFQLACVTDNLGRVILIDAEKGIAIRIWKGYRDAQCGFIKTNEKIGKNGNFGNWTPSVC